MSALRSIGDRTAVRRAVVAPATAAHLPVSATPELEIVAAPHDDWPRQAAELRREEGAVFADLFAIPAPGGTLLTVLFALPERHGWLALRDLVGHGATYPSLTEVVPAATWYEREVAETAAIVARGHIGLRELGLLDADGALGRLTLAPAPEGVVDYPLGPVRSGIVESGHYTIRTVGEEIVDLHLQLGYKHRGVERLLASVAPALAPRVAERLSGTDAVAHALAAVQALEALTGTTISPRAALLRSLFAELERLHNHVGFQADLCQATGLSVAQAQFEILRERLLRLNARLVGHRYLFGAVTLGGVADDLDVPELDDARETVGSVRHALVETGRLAAASASHMDRLSTAGQVSPADAIDLALTGPVARASGLDLDARRDHPYAGYASTAVRVPVLDQGDAAARMQLRLDEALVSADLAIEWADALAREPEPVEPQTRPGAARPSAVGLGWAEGARGTEIHWLETRADGSIARHRVRSASFACWQAFARCVPGSNILTDFPIIEQSFGLSFAGHDR